MPSRDRAAVHAEIGRRVRARRKEVGMAQAELAGHLDRAPYAVVTLEAGRRRILASELLDLADALGVTAGDLLDRL